VQTQPGRTFFSGIYHQVSNQADEFDLLVMTLLLADVAVQIKSPEELIICLKYILFQKAQRAICKGSKNGSFFPPLVPTDATSSDGVSKLIFVSVSMFHRYGLVKLSYVKLYVNVFTVCGICGK